MPGISRRDRIPCPTLSFMGFAYGGFYRTDPYLILLWRQFDAVGAANVGYRASGRGSTKLPYPIREVSVSAGTFACRFRSADLSARSRFCLSVSPNRILRPSLSPPGRCRCAGCFVVRCGLHPVYMSDAASPFFFVRFRMCMPLRGMLHCVMALCVAFPCPMGSIVHAESAGAVSNFYRAAALRRLRRR